MIVVFGSINMDMVMPVPELPQAGQILVSAEGMLQPGGKGATQAIAARRDGARVLLAGAVGRDPLGDMALAALGAAGIDVRRVSRHEADTGRAVQLIADDGHSMTVVHPGANRLARAELVGDALLGSGTTLLVQMETEPAETASLIGRARRLGARVVLNLSPCRVIDTAALRAADLIVGRASEIAWLGEHLGTGNNPASIHAAIGVATVRMMGVQGVDATSDQAPYVHVPSLPVQMRDTTAAADCFLGVLAAALDRGMGLRPALQRAGVAAALSVTRLGALGSAPDTAEIDAAMPDAPRATSQQEQVQD